MFTAHMHTVHASLGYTGISMQPADKPVEYKLSNNNRNQQQNKQSESQDDWAEMNGCRN